MAVTAGLALLVYAVVDAVNVGWGATRTIVCLAAAIVLLIGFVVIELRQRDPLMPFSIFRLRTLRGANIGFSQVPAAGGSFAADVLGPSILAAFGLGFAFVPVTIAAVKA